MKTKKTNGLIFLKLFLKISKFALIFIFMIGCAQRPDLGTEVGNPSEIPEAKCAVIAPFVPIDDMETLEVDPVNQFEEEIIDSICYKLESCGYFDSFLKCLEVVFEGNQDAFLAELGVDLTLYPNWNSLWSDMESGAIIPNMEYSYYCDESIWQSSCQQIAESFYESQDLEFLPDTFPQNWLGEACLTIFGEYDFLPENNEEKDPKKEPSPRSETGEEDPSPPDNHTIPCI